MGTYHRWGWPRPLFQKREWFYGMFSALPLSELTIPWPSFPLFFVLIEFLVFFSPPARNFLGGPGLLLSGLFFAPASEIEKIRKSENQKMEPQK